MKSNFLLVLPLLIFFLFSKVEAENPSLRLIDSYFLKPNSVLLSLDYEDIALNGGLLNLYELCVDYDVNENVLINLYFPYYTIIDANDGGCFGDVAASIKLSLAQSEQLSWRILTEFYFRFPTGVIQEDSYREVNGNILSYYPFSTEAPEFAPSVIASILIYEFVVNAVVTYQSENDPGDGLFDFSLSHDRLDFQVSADYLLKYSILNNLHLFIRPVIYLEYKYNLSDSPIIPTGFYLSMENNIKIENLWRLKLIYSLPLSVENAIDKYLFSVQLGIYF